MERVRDEGGWEAAVDPKLSAAGGENTSFDVVVQAMFEAVKKNTVLSAELADVDSWPLEVFVHSEGVS